MGICVARQPIFTGALKVFGYELLFRGDDDKAGAISADTATSETIINAFHDMGIDRVTNSNRAFVIFTEKLLLRKVATLLPRALLVIKPEIEGTPSDEVVKACCELREMGYSFAFDDIVLTQEYAPLLPLADYVRFDFSDTPVGEIRRRLSLIDTKKVKALAKKLENNGSYEIAKGAGIQLFQGKFFCRPINVRSDKTIAPAKVACLRLINLSANPDVNYDSMAEIIKRDVALSYMLFRVVNSAYFGLYYTVTGIKHALTILGMREIQKWVTLISLARLCDDKPGALISLSLTRARFLELLAMAAGVGDSADDMFLIGLMSLMDVLLDMPLEQVFTKIGISESVSAPLMTGEGVKGHLLRMARSYEEGDWSRVLSMASELQMPVDVVSDCYKEALKWTRRIT